MTELQGRWSEIYRHTHNTKRERDRERDIPKKLWTLEMKDECIGSTHFELPVVFQHAYSPWSLHMLCKVLRNVSLPVLPPVNSRHPIGLPLTTVTVSSIPHIAIGEGQIKILFKRLSARSNFLRHICQNIFLLINTVVSPRGIHVKKILNYFLFRCIHI